MIIFTLLAYFTVNGILYHTQPSITFSTLGECQGYAERSFGRADKEGRYKFRTSGEREDWFQCASKYVEVWAPQ